MEAIGGFSFDTELLRLIADVAIVSYIIYRVLLLIRGTRAAPMLGGLSLLLLVYFLAKPLGLVTLSWILNSFLSSIILVIVVIFQDEIRRALTSVGLQPLFRGGTKSVLERTVEELTLVCAKLSRSRTGALIVLQREVGLDEFLQEGVVLDAALERKLLQSIFVKDSPLHDGAVIVVGDRIKAAGCVLPLSFNPELDPNIGTRHRAAVGITERSDALAIVVSEENGSISLAREGRLVRNLDASMLRDSLHRLIATRSTEGGDEAQA